MNLWWNISILIGVVSCMMTPPPSTWHEGSLNRFIPTESTDPSTVAEILIEPLSSIWNNGSHPHTMLFILFYFFVSCLWFWIELYRQATVSCLKKNKKIHHILHDVGIFTRLSFYETVSQMWNRMIWCYALLKVISVAHRTWNNPPPKLF